MALNSSKSLEDGFKRGFRNIQDEIGDFASLAENAVKNAFSRYGRRSCEFCHYRKNKFFRFCRCGCQRFVPHCHQAGHNPAFDGRNRRLFWIFHSSSGGIIGADNLAAKSASPLFFSNAPRFHSGGIVGDEVPIIAKRGEGVFTREQMKALGDNGTNVNISVKVSIMPLQTSKLSVSKSDQGKESSIWI